MTFTLGTPPLLIRAKAKIARPILSAMRPLFAWRGRILSRHWTQRTRWYDAHAREAIEAMIDVFEMWECGPGLWAMRQRVEALEEITERLEKLRREVEG